MTKPLKKPRRSRTQALIERYQYDVAGLLKAYQQMQRRYMRTAKELAHVKLQLAQIQAQP